MYELNDPELWRERRHELLREAESDRLARQLRSRHSMKRAAGLWNALSGWVLDSPVRLGAQDGGGV